MLQVQPRVLLCIDYYLGEVRGYGGQQGQKGRDRGDYIWFQAPPLVLPSGPLPCPNSPPTAGQGSKLACKTQMKSPPHDTIKVI